MTTPIQVRKATCHLARRSSGVEFAHLVLEQTVQGPRETINRPAQRARGMPTQVAMSAREWENDSERRDDTEA